MRKTMRKTMRKIRWKAGRCPAVFPAVFTVDPGDWRGLEPDAIDTLERLAEHFKADLRRGRKIEAARVLALLDGIAGGADAVAAASAGRATAIGKGFSR